MKVCILGDGLSGLSLAKALVNKGIYTDIFSDRIQNTKDKSRTIGISKSNVEFFNKNIFNIELLNLLISISAESNISLCII